MSHFRVPQKSLGRAATERFSALLQLRAPTRSDQSNEDCCNKGTPYLTHLIGGSALLRKMTCKLSHPMSLRHPVALLLCCQRSKKKKRHAVPRQQQRPKNQKCTISLVLALVCHGCHDWRKKVSRLLSVTALVRVRSINRYIRVAYQARRDLQKRPTKETYKRDLFWVWRLLFVSDQSTETYGQPTKIEETYKRDLQKRPTKETYKRDLLPLCVSRLFCVTAHVCVSDQKRHACSRLQSEKRPTKETYCCCV